MGARRIMLDFRLVYSELQLQEDVNERKNTINARNN
jgi:hypothetical protein